MIEIDGSRYSGSGTIVRQAVAFAALTDQAVRIVDVRARRPKPGLRRQHACVIESIRELVAGTTDGVYPGSKEVVFRPGKGRPEGHYRWNIGSAGSVTALALAVLPLLAFARQAIDVELRGGLFQDFAPSFYHLKFAVLPLLRRMGIRADVEMKRPGYVPRGEGILCLSASPIQRPIRPLVSVDPGPVGRIWGIALSSHLAERKVSHRMAEAAVKVFQRAGLKGEFETLYDDTALQPGAGLAAFADLQTGARLGADLAGAPGRRSEDIGRRVAKKLLEDINSGATLDRHASDQMIPFASLADGESQFRIPSLTDHIESAAWLSREIMGAQVRAEENFLIVRGVGLRPLSQITS